MRIRPFASTLFFSVFVSVFLSGGFLVAQPSQVRVIELAGSYADHPDGPSLDVTSLLSGGPESAKSFYKVCEALETVASSSTIGHVFFDLAAPDLNLNQAQLGELDRRLETLKAEGKKIYAWIENASNVHYSIASAADIVMMADFGSLDLPSLAMQSIHFRDAMDLFGVRVSVTRVGEYKGAVEPFLLSEMSDHLQSHYRSMLETMNQAMVERFAKNRGTKPDAFREIQARRMITATEALEQKLVDLILPYGSARDSVAQLIPGDVKWIERAKGPSEPPSLMTLMNDLLSEVEAETYKSPSIAVLHLQGEIVDGKDPSPGSMVSGPVVEEITALIDEPLVRGVVVRINSPGGSATASEAIRRALVKLAAKKPVVFSMGDMAASGGYWITCIGRPIYAEAGTLTGSIGVFAMKLDFGTLMRRLGVHIENITLDESASAMTPQRGWTPSETRMIQSHVDDVYGRFLEIASRSRGLEREILEPLAGGRVWSGHQAQAKGLVDHLGGLDDALKAVATAAELEPGFDVVHRPDAANPLDMLDLFGSDEEEVFAPLSPMMRAFLERAGFKLSVPLRHLLRNQDSAGPRVMALVESEIRIQ